MKKSRLKVCLVGPKESYPAFDSVSFILKKILGEKQLFELRTGSWRIAPPFVLRPLFCVLQDLMLCLRILANHRRNKINSVFFFQCYYPLSSLALKLLKTKLFLFIGGSIFYWSYLENVSTIGRVLAYANLPIERICYKSADVLITLSPEMIKELGIIEYQHKTYFALPRFDRDFFKRLNITKEYTHRKNLVGYVGLLCKRKGILNFMQAVPLVEDCNFLVIGGGPLLHKINAESKKINKPVEIVGVVSDAKLRESYNEMKLNVLPTYAEGIPSTIFESMACGTPVLVTPVGGITDVIIDGETGFLLHSNDPKRIAERINQLIRNPRLLEKVSANGYRYIQKNFAKDKVLESWLKIFQ